MLFEAGASSDLTSIFSISSFPFGRLPFPALRLPSHPPPLCSLLQLQVPTDILSDSALNAQIARGATEVALFDRQDALRRAGEERYWARLGLPGPLPKRLAGREEAAPLLTIMAEKARPAALFAACRRAHRRLLQPAASWKF